MAVSCQRPGLLTDDALAQARILFARRSFRPALKAYQTVLKTAPNFLPDPRIGIGLCFWMLGERDRARAAWERGMVVVSSIRTLEEPATLTRFRKNPTSPVPGLLLGLAHLNASKDPTLPGGEDARSEQYAQGIKLVTAAFKLDNTQAAAASPLANHFLLTGKPGVSSVERVAMFDADDDSALGHQTRRTGNSIRRCTSLDVRGSSYHRTRAASDQARRRCRRVQEGCRHEPRSDTRLSSPSSGLHPDQ